MSATKDIAMLQRILHHSHPSVTLRYIGITEEETKTLEEEYWDIMLNFIKGY